MSHDAIDVDSTAEIEKESLLQALAVQEIEETITVAEAKVKAERIINEARQEAQNRLDRLPKQLKELENKILTRETEAGTKEGLEIQINSEKELADNLKTWETRVDSAAQNLYQKILKV